MEPVFISDAKVREILESNYKCLYDRLEKAIGEFSKRNGSIVQPVRSCLNLPTSQDRTDGSLFLTMPAFSEHDQALTTKLLSLFPGNTDRPTLQSTVVLFDIQNGSMKAVMDGGALTEIRTAMASALAVGHLTTPKQHQKLAILGSGVQGRGHVDVFRAMFNFNKIAVWSRTFSNAQKLAKEKNVEAYETIEETVKNADVIVTATGTTSSTPLLHAQWVKSNAMICVVGASTKEYREISDEIMMSSVIVADTREAALVESGDIVQTKAEITAELGEVINGLSVKTDGRIVFKSLGMAVEDTVAGKLVFEKRNDKN